jgi:hypothetical protein
LKAGLQKLREIKRGVGGESCPPYLHMQNVKHIFLFALKIRREITFLS